MTIPINNYIIIIYNTVNIVPCCRLSYIKWWYLLVRKNSYSAVQPFIKIQTIIFKSFSKAREHIVNTAMLFFGLIE